MMPSACPLSELDVPGAPLVKSCAYQPPDEAEKLVTKSARMQRNQCARTLGKEAVLVQHSGRVEEQQRRDTQVKERHQAPLAKARPTRASLGPAGTTRESSAAITVRVAAQQRTAGGRGRRCSAVPAVARERGGRAVARASKLLHRRGLRARVVLKNRASEHKRMAL